MPKQSVFNGVMRVTLLNKAGVVSSSVADAVLASYNHTLDLQRYVDRIPAEPVIEPEPVRTPEELFWEGWLNDMCFMSGPFEGAQASVLNQRAKEFRHAGFYQRQKGH